MSIVIGEGGNQISAKSVADHLAAKINAKLNYTPSDEPVSRKTRWIGRERTVECKLAVTYYFINMISYLMILKLYTYLWV